MRKDAIRPKLHQFIPLVEKWRIEDDGYRDEAVERASDAELNTLIQSITNDSANELDKWFTDPLMLTNPSEVYSI